MQTILSVQVHALSPSTCAYVHSFIILIQSMIINDNDHDHLHLFQIQFIPNSLFNFNIHFTSLSFPRSFIIQIQ